MNSGFTVTRQFSISKQRRGRKMMQAEHEEKKSLTGTIPRVARLMALAIRFDQLIRDGVVADQVDLARLGHVSRARLTQIMNLINLAPDIQEEILHLEPSTIGGGKACERQLRPISALPSWPRQLAAWAVFKRTILSNR